MRHWISDLNLQERFRNSIHLVELLSDPIENQIGSNGEAAAEFVLPSAAPGVGLCCFELNLLSEVFQPSAPYRRKSCVAMTRFG